MEVPLCPLCVSPPYNITVPHQGQNKDSRGHLSGSVVAIKGPNEGINASLGHKGAPLSTLCLLFI